MPNPMVCPKCGEVHEPLPRCQAHSKRSGKQCKQNVSPGHRTCHLHGGKAPQTEAKALVRVALEDARERMNTYGLPLEMPTEEGLRRQLARSAGHIEYLVGIIRGLDPEALVWGVTSREARKGVEAGKRTEYVAESQGSGLTAWMVLYFQERRLYLDLLKTAFAVKLEERKLDQDIEVAKVQAAGLAALVNAVTNDPEVVRVLSDEAKDVVRLAVSRQFRAMADAA